MLRCYRVQLKFPLSPQTFITLLCVLFCLSGCDEVVEETPTYVVTEKPFSIEIQGSGEIEAAEAQKIVSPGTQAMTLAWLAVENSMVKKGDVIAKFDAEQLLMDSRTEELEMQLIEQDVEQSLALQYQQQNEIRSEQGLVKHEFDFVDKFAIDDVRVYSKLEIIDTMQNRDFLGAKENFLDWKEGSIDEQNDSALAVLSIKRKGHEVKFQTHQKALSTLQVYAPYDGLLTYEKDRRGEKPSIGQTIFPGRAIAKIPNLENMQAKVFVLARDAIDLAENQNVTIRLDAFPEQNFAGVVNSVSGYPRSIERGNPVTYYELIVALKQQDKSLMQPGRKLSATIRSDASGKSLLVPLQAIYHQQGRSFVYLKKGSRFTEQEVTTGQKNLYFVQVASGLSQGDIIALSTPEQS